MDELRHCFYAIGSWGFFSFRGRRSIRPVGTLWRPHVAWGSFSRFTVYTGTLLWFLPRTLYPLTAWSATAAEVVLGIGLIVGLFTRVIAFVSGILLLTFALAMTFSLGIKAPLDFSVFSASAGAFLLAAFERYPWSLDSLRLRKIDSALNGRKRSKAQQIFRSV